MRCAGTVLGCGIVALAVAGCSGGCGARATATLPAAAEPGPAAAPSLEDRLLALLRGVEAADAGEDFAAGIRRFEAARAEMILLQTGPLDPEQRKSVDAVAVRIEQARRAFLGERVPVEVHGWLRSTAAEASRAETLEEARRRFPRGREPNVLDTLARAFLPEADAAEFDRLLALDAFDRTEEETERLRRFAAAGRSLRVELAGAWSERPKGEFFVTAYGSGTTIVTGPPSTGDEKPPTPEQWWRDATFAEREEWLLTWQAEKAALVEPLRVWDEICASCRPGGAEAAADPRCRACGGGGCIRRVRWR